MRWLIHGPINQAVADALRRHEHQAHSIDELALSPNPAPADVVKAAQSKQWDILTTDADLVNTIYDQKTWFNRAIVFLQLPGGDVEQDDAIDRLFARYPRLSPGRLYTVTESRVKIRQLPSRK
jgi:hypothetical protein